MKVFKKSVSLLLVFVMLFSLAFSTSALDEDALKQSVSKGFYNVVEVIFEKLISTISLAFPVPRDWKAPEKTVFDGLMPGTEEFLTEPADNAVFSLGYDSRSLLENAGEIVGKMYVAGSIAFRKKLATEVVDDLKVRTAAISDGSGRGISVLVVLDAYGLSLPDTREIRARLASFTKEKNINSITVSVLHQHSAVDTLGMNGDIFEMALVNPMRTALSIETKNGKNKEYMENLFNCCVESVKASVNSMKEGKLYYGTASQKDYLSDKRAPYVSDDNFNRFRFVPADGSRETWLVSTEIHCVGNGAAGTAITGDYPYYAEQVINEKADANIMFFMGAQQSTTQNHNSVTVPNEGDSRIENLAQFGKSLGNHLMSIKEENEVSPLLNIRYEEAIFPISNPVLELCGKAGIFEAKIVKLKCGYGVLTEVGYMELGNDLAFAIIPGEVAPEIVYGGCFDKAEAWSKKDWNYPSLQEIIAEAGSTRTLKAIDLANDQIGYIVPDNNFIAMLAPESQSIELVSLGSKTASTLVKAFEKLVKD